MNYNKLLQRQIKKFLPEELQKLPEVVQFINAVQESYTGFERDLSLAERAFNITEQEYSQINNTLKNEIEKRNISIKSLKETIGLFNKEDDPDINSDNLVDVANYIKELAIENKTTAEKIKKQEQLLYISQEIAHIGTWEYDVLNNQIEWTDELFKIRGLRRESFTVNFETFLSGVIEEDRPLLIKITKECIENKTTFNVFYRIVRPNGEIRIINDIGTPIIDKYGAVIAMRGTAQDVTEQKRSEQEIANQKRFTEDILNNIPSDIAVFDENQNYIFLNPTAIKDEEIRKWIIGKNDFDYCDFKGIGYEMAYRRREFFKKTINTPGGIEFLDEYKRNGQTNFVLRKFYPHFVDGKLKFVIGYGIDITHQKNIELELEATLSTIKKVNRELEQFAFVASHDLQEPLRMVTNFLSLFERKYASIIDEKGKQYIAFAVDGAKKMRQIILDLLVFSRAGKFEAELELINMNHLMQDISNALFKMIEDSQAKITCENLPTIKSYRTALVQIFQNLISNSIKYRRRDVVPEIIIHATEKELEWEFSLADNGIGIDAQYFDKIFIIFQRLNNREQYSGTGIGLSVVKKIIESMEGKIWLESVEGEGTTFYFTLSKKYVL